jgi:hypothetical protein
VLSMREGVARLQQSVFRRQRRGLRGARLACRAAGPGLGTGVAVCCRTTFARHIRWTRGHFGLGLRAGVSV